MPLPSTSLASSLGRVTLGSTAANPGLISKTLRLRHLTFFPSPFEEAAILTIDGVGEWATSSIGIGRGNEITLLKELRFPDSLGLLYSAFTYYTGFKVKS